MLERLTNTLLWDKQLPVKLQRTWAVLILLAPLAMGGALWLQWRIQNRTPAHIAIDREEAIQRARRFLEQRGIDLSGMRATVDPDDEMGIYRFLASKPAGAQLLNSPGPWLEIRVQFEDDDGLRTTRVILDPAGRVTGYRLYFPEDHNFGATPSEAAAQQQGQAAIDALLAPYANLRKDKCETTMRKDSSGTSQRYACDVKVEGFAELTADARLSMRGNQITEQSIRFELSDDGERAVRVDKSLRNVFIPYLFVLFVFMVVRYFKRRAQKEISRQRMFVVTAIIGAFIVSQVLLEDEPIQIGNADVAIPFWMPILFFLIGGYLVGQCMGVAYAAAEGDLREKRSSLLTSLDALLSGKIFSRNVGRSVVLGTVLLAWTLLMRNTVYTIAAPALSGMDGIESSYSFLFSRMPWLSLLITTLSAGVLECLSAFACPLSILERRLQRRWLIWGILALCAVTTAGFLSNEPLPAVFAVTVVVIRASALLAAFLGVDLLASLVLAAGLPLWVQFAGLSQLSPLWFEHGVWVAVIASGWIAVQTVCAFFGRVVDPAQVRPSYASEIHERQQLESEVAAAREAQQRLLPAGPPVVEGLTVAASCSAAETVNGDFYDYFPISRTRLGILIIDGGGMGLATALTIALAKGFLMHKAQAGLSPIETLRSLRATLGEELEGTTGEGICFLVVDVMEGSLRYARFGETPSVLITAAAHPPREVRYSEPGVTMWEGYATLAPENRVIIYTNGLSRLVGEPDRHGTDRWLVKKLGGLEWQPAEELLDSILKLSRRGRLGKRKITDDVTVMVCTMAGAAVQSKEYVA